MRVYTHHELIREEDLCIHNFGVQCTNHDKCDKCGWNPKEDGRRRLEQKGRKR